MLESFPAVLIVGTVLGFLSGLGIGGGSLLILWLTLVLNTDPETARILNLLFFVPSAVIACLLRWKQGTLQFRKLLPAMGSGMVAAWIFGLLTGGLRLSLLKKLFGLLLLATGLRELLYKAKKPPSG